MARRLLVEYIKQIFSDTKRSPYWEKIKKLPIILRYCIGIFFIFFGLLGIFTPIPLGIVFFVMGSALLIGIRRARSWTLFFIHITRLHILYSRIYMWWQLRKR